MDFVEKEYFNFISSTFLEFLNSLKTSESNTMVGCFSSQPDLGEKRKKKIRNVWVEIFAHTVIYSAERMEHKFF